MSGCNFGEAIQMDRKPYLISRQKHGIHHASLGKPALSVWQSAVLAYASAKSGIAFTSIEQADRWLRTNPLNPKHLAVKAVCGLLVVEPPKKVRTFPPTQPPTAA
jgi:hypothetical protein